MADLDVRDWEEKNVESDIKEGYMSGGGIVPAPLAEGSHYSFASSDCGGICGSSSACRC